MALVRGFSKVDKEGKIPIPKNIAREAKLEPGQLVELKISGPAQAQYIIVHKRTTVR